MTLGTFLLTWLGFSVVAVVLFGLISGPRKDEK